MLQITHSPPIDVAKAKSLGKFLAQYEIKITGLTVLFCNGDGACTKATPMADTIIDLASGAAGGIAAAPAMAPAAVPVAAALTAVLGPFAFPALLGALGLEAVATHSLNKRVIPQKVDKKPVEYSTVEFRLTNVGPNRLRWTEYLIAIWTINNGGQVHGLAYPDQKGAARRYIERYGRGAMPTPWGASVWGGSRRRAGSRRRRRRSTGLGGALRDVKRRHRRPRRFRRRKR